MGLSTWLKERRLERVHRKLKHLRAIQARLREQESDLAKQRKASASTELQAKERKLHEERERVTREVHTLQVEEEKLKAELKQRSKTAPA
ncbi:MAG TPA: hypothetical protein VM582_05285 [Candidatus Thermoplasmatota archaeon]|nr:hypothetical protein [Candidatus Thermoplasmatota archaeon]